MTPELVTRLPELSLSMTQLHGVVDPPLHRVMSLLAPFREAFPPEVGHLGLFDEMAVEDRVEVLNGQCNDDRSRASTPMLREVGHVVDRE